MQNKPTKKTEKQNRAWLAVKLENYLWKIKKPNAYGSLKKQQTIVKDLQMIVDQFNKNI